MPDISIRSARHTGVEPAEHCGYCSPVRRLALPLGVGFLLAAGSALAARQGAPAQQRSADALSTARTYLVAVRAHDVGVPDGPARTIAAWPTQTLDAARATLAEIASVVRVAAERDARMGRPRQPFIFRGRAFTYEAFARYFELPPGDDFLENPNGLFKRAAMLHMDIAMYVTDIAAAASDAPGRTLTRRVTLAYDGQGTDSQDRSEHWVFAREALDLVGPSPSLDEWVHDWYMATTRWMLRMRRWNTLLDHATHAARLFPREARFAFELGVVHEDFATPGIQAIREAAPVSVESATRELERAAPALRDAVALDPAFAEARLHYGHTLAMLDRYQESRNELVQAAAALQDPRLAYYAALFRGYTERQLGSRSEAATSFEQAAALFPRAQSPLLGLSQTARQFDDRDAAAAALARLFALPPRHDVDDPWWDYDVSPARDADDLVTALRKPFAGTAR
jgi:tetratricopeptide (TPR) repeat protein